MRSLEELTKEVEIDIEHEKEQNIKNQIREYLTGIANASQKLKYWQDKLGKIEV